MEIGIRLKAKGRGALPILSFDRGACHASGVSCNEPIPHREATPVASIMNYEWMDFQPFLIHNSTFKTQNYNL
jgi:hypothetical protein